MERFVQLSNGDLWKGRKTVTEERADNVQAMAPATAEDAVMEMVNAQRSETISCVWCGQNFSRKDLNAVREHVEAQHASVLKPIASITNLTPIEEYEILAKIEAQPLK